jgi:CBS domain-containing protein
MSTVREILLNKGTQVLSIGTEATVLDAALLMNDHKIGALVVIDAGQLVGIISERDMLQRVIVQRRDPGTTLVRDVMTAEVICCRPYTRLDEARGVMKNRRIRHLPVVDDDGRLVGLISIGDLNAYDAHAKEVTVHILEEYIHGRA